MSQLVEIGKKSLAARGGEFAKGMIEDMFDPAVAEAKVALKDLLPGEALDGLAESILSTFAPELKKALLAQIEKAASSVKSEEPAQLIAGKSAPKAQA